MTAWEAVQLGLGVGSIGLALLVLWSRRAGASRQETGVRLGEWWVSQSTRLSLGLGLLIVGYHLVVWSVGLDVPSVEARLWPVVVGLPAVAIAGNWAMDTMEQRSASPGHGEAGAAPEARGPEPTPDGVDEPGRT